VELWDYKKVAQDLKMRYTNKDALMGLELGS